MSHMLGCGRYTKGLIFLILFLVVCSSALAQQEAGPRPESPWWREVEVTEETRSPFWAMLSSLLLPGGGQFYTENEFRGLLFFAAQGALLGMTIHEHVETQNAWRRYKRSGDSRDYDDYSNHFERRKQLFWWDAAVWFLSLADAYTDSHMFRFREGGRVAALIQPKDRGFDLELSLRF